VIVHLDTSALVGALAGRRLSLPRLREFVREGHRVKLSAPVLYEWLRGPRTVGELQDQETLLPRRAAVRDRGRHVVLHGVRVRDGGVREDDGPVLRRRRLNTARFQEHGCRAGASAGEHLAAGNAGTAETRIGGFRHGGMPSWNGEYRLTRAGAGKRDDRTSIESNP